MTRVEIQKMKQTDTLVLTKAHLFWHYSVVFFLLTVPVSTTIDVFEHYVTRTYKAPRPIETTIATGYFWVVPAIALFFIQRRRLKFKVLKICVDPPSFKEAVELTAKELEWAFQKKTKDVIIAYRSRNGTGSWGEMITIIRDKDRILMNSICDPENRPSVTSWGMNKTNLKTLERYLRKTSAERSFVKSQLKDIDAADYL